MGLLWRLFAPKPLKKARRSVRKVTHPLNAITPRPIKQARRAVNTVTHPWEAAEFAVENQVVRALRGRGKKRTAVTRRTDGIPARFTQGWIERTMPRLNPEQTAHVLAVMRARGWSDSDLRARVYPYLRR